jgi:hypothetical protein
MLIRLIVGAGLFAFGYYLGKQVGMTEPLRADLARAREQDDTDPEADKPENEPH